MIELRALIPPIIAELDRGKPWQNWRSGAILFSDVSGFTAMSETLAALGAEGAEILTDILNRYFAEMISIVNTHGGQVMKFGGDAILCFFPEDGGEERGDESRRTESGKEPETLNSASEPLRRALHASWKMQETMTRFQRIRTPVKRFALKMKIGLAGGEALLSGVGDPAVRCDYVFAGEPVDRAVEAEHRAQAGEIVFAGTGCGSRSSNEGGVDDQCKLQNAKCKMEEIEPGLFRILGVTPSFGTRDSRPETVPPFPSALSLPPSALKPYLIREVHDLVVSGHGAEVGSLLEAVPVFARITGFAFRRGEFALEKFHAYFQALMRSVESYGGRLNRLSMGDKGCTLLLLFGAPSPLEQKERLACQWALDARALAAADFPGVALGVGMHTGRLFSGIVGARDRAEYTVMGDGVNLAARLMERAAPGQILSSAVLAGRAEERFVFQPLGGVRMKGKASAVEAAELLERRRQTRVVQAREALVGRAPELETLAGLLKAAGEGAPSLAVVEGEAGVGKSFLAGHLLDRARSQRWRIVPVRGEITRSTHAYAPWAELLRALLFGGRDPDQRSLEEALGDGLLSYLPWYARLFELPVPDGVRSPAMDEETNKNLFHHQVCDLVLSRAERQPLVLFLDDLHWFDTLSLELLGDFLNHLKGQRVFLLATARPVWNRKGIAGRPGCRLLPLESLDRDGVKALAEEALKGPVRDEAVRLVLEKTGGNPFFAREFIAHLAAGGALVSRLGEWTLDRTAEARALPTGADLIVSRLEKLDPAEQAHVRLAACMGPTFSIPVLRQALGRDYRAEAVEALVRRGTCQRLDAETCTFPHALVQESLYHSIPLRLRRRNHRRIADAMERIHAGDLDRWAPNLANHFFIAGNRPKAFAYSLQAGRGLFDRLSFPEACTYFDRAWRLMGRGAPEERFPAGLEFARAMLRAGKLKECQALAARIKRKIAGQDAFRGMYVDACLIQFYAMEKLGNHSFVNEAQRMLVSLGPALSEASFRLRYITGFALFRRGDYDSAEEYFLAMLGGEHQHPALALEAYLPLASIEKSRHRWENAFRITQLGLAVAERLGNRYQELRLRIEYANICIESGDQGKAEEQLERTLRRTEEIGDFYLLANIYYNLGKLHLNRGTLDRAEELLKEAAALCLNLGIVNGQANALMHLGIVYFYRQHFYDAYTYYFESAHLFEKIKEIPDLCWDCFNLAEVCIKLEKREEAREWHQKGLKLFKAEDNPELFRLYQELAQSL